MLEAALHVMLVCCLVGYCLAVVQPFLFGRPLTAGEIAEKHVAKHIASIQASSIREKIAREHGGVHISKIRSKIIINYEILGQEFEFYQGEFIWNQNDGPTNLVQQKIDVLQEGETQSVNHEMDYEQCWHYGGAKRGPGDSCRSPGIGTRNIPRIGGVARERLNEA